MIFAGVRRREARDDGTYKLTPHAKVLVHTSTCILAAVKSSSTVLRSWLSRPAWWMPMPNTMVSLSAESLRVEAMAMMSSSGIFKNFLGLSSEAQYEIRSRAVSRVCRLEDTNTRAGFTGECSRIAA